MEKTMNDLINGNTCLGIELGSTRIKAVLTDAKNAPIAGGAYEWENRLEDGIWTYHMEDVYAGLAGAYADLKADVKEKYGVVLTKVGCIGISAMMHGYLVFDEKDQLLVPFRTWRNTITGEASEKLSAALNFHIPQRYSIAHLYQAALKAEPHVNSIAHMTTLAGYVHFLLSGKRVMGVGEASGMFPVDGQKCEYDEEKLEITQKLLEKEGVNIRLKDILPDVLCAGEDAGMLTNEGALLLDPSRDLTSGIPLCPPEGDAGTGMAATNSVSVGTGNVSAGTSIFGMVVMEKNLSRVYDEIDIVTTPTGELVAMAHCNNCSSDINAWVNMFDELLALFGANVNKDELYTKLFKEALKGAKDGGGIMAYNYFSGEHITGLDEGRPLMVRTPDARLSLANFMRVQLMTSMATLKYGMDILVKEEGVTINNISGHGGLFKTKGVADKLLAAALNTNVTVMETAGEGGAWGMALLCGYRMRGNGRSLVQFLEEDVFAETAKTVVTPDAEDAEGFDRFLEVYKKGLSVEKAAVNVIK